MEGIRSLANSVAEAEMTGFFQIFIYMNQISGQGSVGA
jgi:hypothetical protein